MKNEMYNFAPRLEDMILRLKKKNEDLAVAVEDCMTENNLDRIICEEQFRRMESGEDPVEFEPDIRGGSADLELYHKIARSTRLLSLAGQKPQEFMAEEADFLFGCPMRYEDFSDDDIDAIRFDPNVEAVDERTFYYVWIYFGEFDEIKMAAKVDSDRGTVHPLPFIPVKSDYDLNGHANEGILTADERRILIDRMFYASLIPDEITDDVNEEEIEWTEDIEDDEEDEAEWIYPDDEEEEDEWTEDIDDDEEDEDEWIYPDDEGEEDEWTEDIDEDDDDDINKVLAEETRLFDEHTITITVLSVTDLHGQPRTPEDGAVYDNIQGFVGKILPIVIGEEMTIYDPESNVVPIPEEKLYTSPVMFHSEELISDNEIKHIVRTRDSIYTFTERRKNYSSTADSEDGSVVF